MLCGPRCTLHASVFERAAAYGYSVVHCDWRGAPVSLTATWSSNSLVGRRHRCQASLPAPRRKQAWQRIVQAKIRAQASVLTDAATAARLRELAAGVRSNDAGNAEGTAARLYWPRLFAEPTFRRRPGSGDGANALLDYGYAILRGACLRGIVAAGLWPSLGLWHHRRDDQFALVDDVIEPFRPAVDAVVAALVGSGAAEVGKDERVRLAGVLDAPFAADNVTVGPAILAFCQRLAVYVEGEADVLDVPTLDSRAR